MFSINKNGKVACVLATPAYLLSLAAEYALRHRYDLIDNPLLSPVINYILLPYRIIEAFLLVRPTYTEPSLTHLTIFYVFEDEAIPICFVASVIMSAFAIYFSVKAAQDYEFSIWYTNAFLLCFLALLAVNAWIGLVALTTAMVLVSRIRRLKQP